RSSRSRVRRWPPDQSVLCGSTPGRLLRRAKPSERHSRVIPLDTRPTRSLFLDRFPLPVSQFPVFLDWCLCCASGWW
ncbi:unnamed protein product, partial [Callosobruchus maculatus]